MVSQSERIRAIGSNQEKAALLIKEGMIALADAIKYAADKSSEPKEGKVK